MPKINGGTTVLLLNGEPMKDVGNDMKPLTVGKAIASILANGEQSMKAFGSFKAYVLALDFFTKEEVDVDEADFHKLESLMEIDNTFPPIIAGQIIHAIKKAKDHEIKPTETASPQ